MKKMSPHDFLDGVAERWRFAICLCLAALLPSVSAAQTIQWTPVGAAPNTGGQTENVKPDNQVVGAVNAVAVHPTDAEILYVGSVNGGIWRTENAMAASPQWTPLIDEQEALSIGAIEFDPLDETSKTVVAGMGGFSSFGVNGARLGILRTTDGSKWKLLNGMGEIQGLSISGVAPRGDIIVISAAQSESASSPGVWRSTDVGASWTCLSDNPSSGLPEGDSFDLCGDPANPSVMFVHAGDGIFKSDDIGATWTRVSDQPMKSLLASSVNVEIAMGKHDNVYVAVVGGSQQLAAVFHSADAGTSWKSMKVPSTSEGGIHPGRQGSLHLSLAADPTHASIVYIGGDRQDLSSWPNSIGAKDYSGCLFRGDSSQPVGNQWVHLTHSSQLGAAGGGTGSNTSPHADSRAMAIASNGVLIEADDGGVYRRTSPTDNTGDWFSINGNLQTSEYHAIAWDSNANVVVAGAQDTGTSEQILSNNLPFRSIATADGGVVAVDDKTTAGRSVRFSSYQNLGRLTRRTFDANNQLLSSESVPMSPLGAGGPPAPQFYTPLAINSATPARLVIGAGNGVYESLNRGDTVRLIGPGIVANESGQDPIAYGAANNPNAIYVGAHTSVYIRSGPHPAPLVASATYPGGLVMSVTMAANDWKTAFVIDPSRVMSTGDAGATWTDITGNLPSLKPRTLRCVAHIPGEQNTSGSLIVGSDRGVFGLALNGAGTWLKIGDGLPKVPVYHLEYDSADQILLAGTLGRGAWTILPSAPSTIPQLIQQNLAMAPPAGQPAAAEAVEVANPSSQPITLREGLIVEPSAAMVLAMQPIDASEKGGIAAISIADGQVIWETRDAQKPLSAAQGRVVAQAASDAANEFKVSVLDAKTGRELTSSTRNLAGGVKSLIEETSDAEFNVFASTSGANATISWQFIAKVSSGVRPGALPNADEITALEAPSRIGASSGTFQLDMASGELQPLNVETPIAPLAESAVPDSPETLLPNVEGEQFESLDKRHVIGSVLTGDDTVWDKYTLQIFDKSTQQRVGQLKSHFAIVPILVVKDRIITVQEPLSRTVENELVTEQLKIRVFDLSGTEVWQRVVRDTEFRGPLPP